MKRTLLNVVLVAGAIGVVSVWSGIGVLGGKGVMQGVGAPPPEADAQKQVEKQGEAATRDEEKPSPDPRYVLDHVVKRIDGEKVDLRKYEGRVVAIVNTASKCGLTPQYEGLEKLYRAKEKAGLVVLAFPSNDFRGQEPGKNSEIAAFCKSEYGVTFPVFEKVKVLGEDRARLYKDLVEQAEPIGGDPEWNFTKFVVGRDGRVAARFGPRVKPDDEAFVKKVDELLSVPVKSADEGTSAEKKTGVKKGD